MDSTYILSKSYYCCRLRTGCIILGYIELVSFLIGTLTFVLVVTTNPSPDDTIRNSAIILLTASITCLVSGITLLVGTYERNSDVVLAHLVVAIITIILCWAALFILVMITPWYLILVAAILIVSSIYNWLVAFSYFITLAAAGDGSSDADTSDHGAFQRVSL